MVNALLYSFNSRARWSKHKDDAKEIESQTGLRNLLMAYSEAIDLGQKELSQRDSEMCA